VCTVHFIGVCTKGILLFFIFFAYFKWQTFISYLFLKNIIFVHETNQRYWNLTKLYLKSSNIISMVTYHGMDCLVTKSWLGWGFLHLRGPTLRPTQPPVQLVLGLFPGGKSARARHWPPTPSSIMVGEWVELYLCSPLWPFMAGSRVNFTLIYSRDEAENIRLWNITLCMRTPLMHDCVWRVCLLILNMRS